MIMTTIYLIGFAAPFVLLFVVLAWKNPLLFLGIHISTRAILDGISYITYQGVAAGISIMQIYSIGIVLFLFVYLFVKKKEIENQLFPFIIPVALIVLSYVFSSLLNGFWLPVVENSTKWIYMLLISGFIVYALHYYKIEKVMLVLWISVLPAVFIQLHAFAMGNSFVAAAGHVAYRGGFHHQAVLSYFLLAFTCTSIYFLISYNKLVLKAFFSLCALYGIFAIYLCGYRTTLVALIILLIITMLFYLKKANVEKKILGIIIVPIFFLVVQYLISSDLAQRLSDLIAFVQNPSAYLDFSGNAKHVELMSGRINIINVMMAAFFAGSFDIYIFGYGTGYANELIGTYSHNEFLSSLVETGILGFTFFLYFIFNYILRLFYNFKFANLEESVIVGIGIGLLVMAFATMPFRDMRAMFLFGMVLGIMHYYSLTNTQNKLYECT